MPHANDLQALTRYVERYTYDPVGNIQRTQHRPERAAGIGGWTRRYQYASDSNRLLATSLPGDLEGTFSAKYTYDTHGSMTSMPHLMAIDWDYADRIQHVDKSGGGHVFFTYDASGQRVRKVYEHSGLVEERIYLGGFEIYRRHRGDTLELERETLHVMDDQHRVAMVETKTIDPNNIEVTPMGAARWRFQLDNLLGSAVLELDAAGNVISYEEYHPYGSTAFHSVRGRAEVSAKRYRYTGKERDEETGLYYHGARYYAAWLGRWTAADPLGFIDGLNLYRYSRDNPVLFSDPTGTLGCDSSMSSCNEPEQNMSLSTELETLQSSPILRENDAANESHREAIQALREGTAVLPPFDPEQFERDVATALAQTETPEYKLAFAHAQVQRQQEPEPASSDTLVRVVGGIQVIGGAVELVGAGALALAPEPTMATKAGAVVLGAHGIDTVVSGFRTLVSGEEIHQTLTAQGASGTARALGASPPVAEGTGVVADILAGTGPALAAGISRRAAIAAARGAEADLVNLASAGRTRHILVGDATGGGHLWPGAVGKTPFPEGWSGAQVMHHVSDIATDPALTWVQQTGRAGSFFTRAGDPARFFVIGERGGIQIKVILEPAGEGIITAFPH